MNSMKIIRIAALILLLPCSALLAQTNLGPIKTTTQESVGVSSVNLPQAGDCLAYFNLSTGLMNWINSSGASCGPSGSGGTISGLTPGVIPQAGSSTSIINTSPQLDNGVTTPGALTYAGPVQAASDGVHSGNVRMIGNTTLPINLPATGFWGFLGFNSTSAGSYFFQANTTPPTVGQVLAAGTPGTCTGSSATCIPLNYVTPAGTGLPSSPQIGDTIRYNLNSTNAWETASMANRFYVIYHEIINDTFQFYGAGVAAGPVKTGTISIVDSTASDGTGGNLSAPATSSTSTVVGLSSESNANFGSIPIGSYYRFSIRAALGSTNSNLRYWMGVTIFDTGLGGTSGVLPGGTTSFATNSPTRATEGFRDSGGTDAHWQAVAIKDSTGATTIVDTGITPDTNPHLFEITTTGTTLNYYIDHSLVATISSANVPPVTNPGFHNTGLMFICGDNENTNTAMSLTVYWMGITLK